MKTLTGYTPRPMTLINNADLPSQLEASDDVCMECVAEYH